MNAVLYPQMFEREKNIKALLYTILVLGSLFLLLYFVSWVLPVSPPPPVNEGIEVNLGNSEQGLGDVAPLIPGDPADAADNNFNPAQTTQASAETQHEVAENNEADATPINTSSKPELKKPVVSTNTPVKNNTNKPVTQAVPTPPKPKAVYNGGKGTGGNNPDTYNNSTNQGVAGGNGDQGKPNGNPNSDSYNGNSPSGSAGISISRGLDGRRIASAARFEDEYKYGGKVSVDVTVDENGNVTSAKVKPGSPFADLNAIAVKRAYQLKFNKGTSVQSGTIVIVFENPKG